MPFGAAVSAPTTTWRYAALYSTQRPLVGYDGELPPATLSGLFGADYGNRVAGSNEDNFVAVSANGVDFRR